MNDAVLSADCQAFLENMNTFMLILFWELVENSAETRSVLPNRREKNLFGFISL